MGTTISNSSHPHSISKLNEVKLVKILLNTPSAQTCLDSCLTMIIVFCIQYFIQLCHADFMQAYIFICLRMILYIWNCNFFMTSVWNGLHNYYCCIETYNLSVEHTAIFLFFASLTQIYELPWDQSTLIDADICLWHLFFLLIGWP